MVADHSHVDTALLAMKGGQRGDRVIAVETDVAGEMVSRPERHANERNIASEGDCGHRRERSVAAGHPQGFGALGSRPAGHLVRVLSFPKDMHLHAECSGLLD